MSKKSEKLLNIPMIPPLNSSKYNKENLQRGNSNCSTKNRAVATNLTSKKSTITDSVDGAKKSRSNNNAFSPFQSPGDGHSFVSSSRHQRSLLTRGVLRYGETIESLFHFDANPSEEYRNLCRQIVDNHRQQSPEHEAASWRRILELAITAMPQQATSDLIRLHRRATSRFTAAMDSSSRQFRLHLLHIWLSYAKVLKDAGQEKDANLTLRHIQNQKLDDFADFYLVTAEIEPESAESRLREGIEKQAQPVEQLENALRKYLSTTSAKAANNNVVSSPKRRSSEAGNVGSSLSAKRRKIMPQQHDEVGPTCTTAASVGGDESMETSETSEIIDTSMENTVSRDNNETKDSISFQLAPLPSSKFAASPKPDDEVSKASSNKAAAAKVLLPTTISTAPSGRNVQAKKDGKDSEASAKDSQLISCDSKSKTSSNHQETMNRATALLKRKQLATSGEAIKDALRIPEFRAKNEQVEHSKSSCSDDLSKGTTPNSQPLQATTTRKPLLTNSRCSNGTNKRRPPLLSKISRFGSLGKPERLDPSQSVMESESDSEPESIPAPVTKTPGKILNKMDLSYIFEWKPERRSETPATKTNSSFKASQSKSNGLDKIDETPSLSLSSASNGTHRSDSSSHKSLNNSTAQIHDESSNSNKSGDGKLVAQQSLGTPQQQPGGATDLLATANTEFLPLISEDNMLRVNNVPYAKLGVIGKGGSCKVYRALSKDCNVFAIKKVKLEKLEKKQIDGYANEIALLKRLRGNPAIIQLLDSEVDLKRKSIFLVMEPGEADLNHVLQKQALASSGSNGERRLNMNFIRLTWQQMLVAVNSIHEERIIHGDLKPSNFLFVRGALKLIDFGIAKAIQSDDTTNIYRETQIGTLNYMSPEAILDSGTGTHGQRMKCGRPSDIWSLGCILYQMVYGRTPFAELHWIQKLQAIVNPDHKIIFNDNVDEAALDAMKSCLQRKPADRPPIVGKNGLLSEHRFLNWRKAG